MKRSGWFLAGLLMFWPWGLATPIGAQELGTITGQVTGNDSGDPIAGAIVALIDAPASSLTDSAGVYVLRNVPPGVHGVRASHLGYVTETVQVNVGAGTVTTLDVQLRQEALLLEGVAVFGESRSEAALREVRESPFSVTAIDAQRLADRGLTLTEAVQRVAGVQVRRSGGLGSASIFNVRGLEGKRVQVFVNGNSVNVLGDDFNLDGIPIVLVERVEVYKGIVPARFGGDGLGAAINVVIRDFEEGYDDLGYTFGTYGQHQLSAVTTRTLTTGINAGLAVTIDRAANDYRMRSPFVPELEIRRDHDRFRRELVGGVFEIERGWFDHVHVEGAVVRNNQEVQGIQTNVQHAETGGHVAVAVLDADREGALDGRLDLRLGLIGAWSQNSLVDTSSVRYTFEGNPYPSPNGRGELGQLPSHSDNRSRTVRQRGTVTYRMSEVHVANLTYRLDWARLSPRDTLANRFAGRNVSEFPGRQASAVIGVSHEWRPGDGRFLNVAGTRGYHFRSEGTPSNIFDPSAERPPLIRNRSTSFGASNASRYFITPDLLAKGSVELARRLPATTELFGDGLLIQPAPALRPEESLSFNLGVLFERSRATGRHVQLEFNVFRMHLKDMIRLASGGFAGVAGHVNLGKAHISGFDVEAKGDVTPWFYASAALTYQNARDALRDTPGTTVPNPTHGLRIPNMPWLFGSMILEFHRTDLFGAMQRSRFFHELDYTEEYFYAFEMSQNQDRRIPRTLTHTVGIEHQWLERGLTLSAEIQNITDTPVMNQFNHPLPGRTARVSVRYTRVLDTLPMTTPTPSRDDR